MIRRIALLCVVLAVPAFGQTTLNGAGATFPNPMYQKWFSEYHKAHPDIQFNYQSIGSGGGIRQVLAQTVDFGASDGPMTDEQLSQAKTKILHIPTVLGAVVPAYNVPGVTGELKFTPEALAGIFLGKITNWNDPAIAKANPGVNLPNQTIIVVHRSDGSGTTYIFTDYLSKVSSDWAEWAGQGNFGEVAGRPGRQRQRRRGGNDPPDAGCDRLHRTDLRGAEQDRLRYGEKRRRDLREGSSGSVDGSGRFGKEHARGLPRFHHQRARQGCLSDFQLYLVVDSGTNPRTRPRARSWRIS